MKSIVFNSSKKIVTSTATSRDIRNGGKLSLFILDRLSAIHHSTFTVFKEHYKDDTILTIYGESLSLWISIGGLIKGATIISRENGISYINARISPSVFFGFIFGRPDIFEVSEFENGYKVKMLHYK